MRLHLLKKLQCIGTRFAQSPKKTKERKKKEKKDEICSLVLTPKKHINILHYISLWYSAASEKHMQRPIGLAIKQVYFSHLRAIHESRMNMYSDQLKAIYPTLPIDKKRTTNQIDQDLLSERISKAITSIQVTINCIDRFTCLQRWKISSYLTETDGGDTLVTNYFHHHSAKGEIHLSLSLITNYYHKQKHSHTYVALLCLPYPSFPRAAQLFSKLGIIYAPYLVLDVAQNNKS